MTHHRYPNHSAFSFLFSLSSFSGCTLLCSFMSQVAYQILLIFSRSQINDEDNTGLDPCKKQHWCCACWLKLCQVSLRQSLNAACSKAAELGALLTPRTAGELLAQITLLLPLVSCWLLPRSGWFLRWKENEGEEGALWQLKVTRWHGFKLFQSTEFFS